MSVVVFVEGGGKGGLELCRRGFGTLFEKLLGDNAKPRVVACGGRDETFKAFSREIGTDGLTSLLLVDADEAVAPEDSPWAHLIRHRKWKRPAGTGDDSAHLMVRTMEAWLLSDPDVLAAYYGRGFRKNAVRAAPDIESVSKADLEARFKAATRDTKTGTYHKTQHGFVLLARVDPGKVAKRSRHARRFFELLKRLSRSARSLHRARQRRGSPRR